MWCFVSLFLIDSTSAIDCLERLVSEMTCYVSIHNDSLANVASHNVHWMYVLYIAARLQTVVELTSRALCIVQHCTVISYVANICENNLYAKLFHDNELVALKYTWFVAHRCMEHNLFCAPYIGGEQPNSELCLLPYWANVEYTPPVCREVRTYCIIIAWTEAFSCIYSTPCLLFAVILTDGN